MRLRWKIAMGLVLVGGGVAGVVGATAGSDPTTPTGTNVSAPRTYPTVGVALDPPPPGVQPSVSSVSAWAVWQSIGIHPEAAKVARSAAIELGDFTNNMYGTINSDNSVTPTFQHRLSWIVSFQGVPETPIGPAPPPGVTLPPKPTVNCDFFLVVDAATGGYLSAYDVCPGPSGA